MKSYRAVTDPDHPAYSDDALEDFAAHTRKAQQMVEELLEGGKWCAACRAVSNHRAEDHEEPTDAA